MGRSADVDEHATEEIEIKGWNVMRRVEYTLGADRLRLERNVRTTARSNNAPPTPVECVAQSSSVARTDVPSPVTAAAIASGRFIPNGKPKKVTSCGRDPVNEFDLSRRRTTCGRRVGRSSGPQEGERQRNENGTKRTTAQMDVTLMPFLREGVRAAAGRYTVIVVPSPSWVSTPMSPPHPPRCDGWRQAQGRSRGPWS